MFLAKLASIISVSGNATISSFAEMNCSWLPPDDSTHCK